MYKTVISFLFTLMFSVMLVTPSIVTLFDFDCEIALLIDVNEEEEKEGKESSKDKNPKILVEFAANFSLNTNYCSNNLEFYSNTYSSNFLELISPPPENRL